MERLGSKHRPLSDGRWQTALTQLGIPISGLAIHPVVKMASFRLSFESSHTSAGQEPAESRHDVVVATTSPYIYKQLHIPQVEREQAIQRSFLQQPHLPLTHSDAAFTIAYPERR
jgi:hypothetical protein